MFGIQFPTVIAIFNSKMNQIKTASKLKTQNLLAPFFPAAFLPTPFPFPSRANSGRLRPGVGKDEAEVPEKNTWEAEIDVGRGLGEEGDWRPEKKLWTIEETDLQVNNTMKTSRSTSADNSRFE